MTLKKVISLFILLMTMGMLSYYYFPEQKLVSDVVIDSLVVHKSKRKMIAYSKGQSIKTYTISLGKVPVGAKDREGDLKTPEGTYYINDKNPNSGYYKNLGISYPNEKDIAKAKSLGAPTGGDIKIHGLRNDRGYIHKFHRWFNWTNGCIAVTNTEMEGLYQAVPNGTKIEIKP